MQSLQTNQLDQSSDEPGLKVLILRLIAKLIPIVGVHYQYITRHLHLQLKIVANILRVSIDILREVWYCFVLPKRKGASL